MMGLSLFATAPDSNARGDQKIRRAVVAGSFYPAEPAKLVLMMEGMLAKAQPVVEGKILAAVAPHAAYEYSGPAGAATYAALRGHNYSRVIVIAPSHYASFDFSSVYDGDAYDTPLGAVPVDKEFARQLCELSPTIRLSDKGHAAALEGGEHSIEVHLPWLKKVLGDFVLVPIVMGNHSYESSRALGASLAQLTAREQDPDATLVLASSDLSHYHGYADARDLDKKTLEAMRCWDYLSLSRNFSGHVWEACGGAPIVASMVFAERMGANRAEVLRYENSADRSGDRSRVVGYGAVVFAKSACAAAEEKEFLLEESEKAELLAIAHRSVEQIVNKHELYEPRRPASEVLNRECGAFVTILKSGHLRGCIGYTSAVKPLYMTVRDTAALAAMRDVRFHPVSADELPELEYEVSVLSPMRHVADVEQIAVGRDGLLVKDPAHEGLLLPQVPVEHHWDKMRFLEETCAKAGMDRHDWHREETDVFRFSAFVCAERTMKDTGMPPRS